MKSRSNPPPAYLEALTLRLAAGAGRLSDPLRRRHALYLARAQNTDGGFSGRAGQSDLYYAGFALRGLALAGGLQGDLAARAAQFLKGRLTSQAPLVDFISLVYGAMLLETAAGIDIFAGAAPGWPEAVAETLERFRRPDGGYGKTDSGEASSTYHTFLVVVCRQLVGLPLVEPGRLAAFVRSRRRDDGGFVEVGPMRTSGTNPTAAAAGLLAILEAFDDQTRDSTVGFLAGMQSDEGGLRANTRIPWADLLSTFTGVLTLADLDALDQIDVTAARRYVVSLEMPDGGFRGGLWDAGTDVEYTFYGLGALALLSRFA